MFSLQQQLQRISEDSEEVLVSFMDGRSKSVDGDCCDSEPNTMMTSCSMMAGGQGKELRRSCESKTSELSHHSLDNVSEGDDDDDDDVIQEDSFPFAAATEVFPRKGESCSSYSSLNNDDASGSQESIVNQHFHAGFSGPSGFMPPLNYPRKYSLTVPGEPRHMRTLHRRESGSRSPLNSSCGGLSHSELSTPSPSCSNSM